MHSKCVSFGKKTKTTKQTNLQTFNFSFRGKKGVYRIVSMNGCYYLLRLGICECMSTWFVSLTSYIADRTGFLHCPHGAHKN